jgi:PTS system sucrose-specific IIC component
MDHGRVAQTVLDAVGGPDNISAAAHCATRLRLVLNDQEKVDQATLDNDMDIKGTFSAGGMYQIIVGPGDVDHVYDKLIALGVKEASKAEAAQEAAQQGNLFTRFIKMVADIFVPVLPALVAGGLMMALNNILTAKGLFGELALIDRWPAITDIASMIQLLSSAPFAFLPVLIGFSATKRFGGNPYLGATMGAAMVMPQLVNGWGVAAAIADGTMEFWNIFGIQVAQAGYQGQVIPVLFVSFLLATIEKQLHKWFKGTTDFLLTPLVTILTTGFLTFMLVGPLTRQLADAISFGLLWLYESTGFIGGLIFGLLYSPIVVTGLHQSFPAVELTLLPPGGPGSFIFPVASMANIAQGGAALAVFLAARDAKLKGMAGAASASALMGITEPAIFGVNLRLRWPFFIAIGSAAIGSALISIFDVRAVALGAAGLIGFVSIDPVDIPMFVVCALVTLALSFGVAFVYARSKGRASIAGTHVGETIEEEALENAAAAAAPAVVTGDLTDLTVTAPLTGKAIPLSEVKDPIFSGGTLGPGAAIVPTSGHVVSPVDGEVIVAFPTGHAYGLRSASGVEILIHVGMDTVQLGGKHFQAKVKVGQRVRRGDLLAEVDLAGVAAAGYDTTTPVVVTNAKAYQRVDLTARGPVATGDQFLTAVAPATV